MSGAIWFVALTGPELLPVNYAMKDVGFLML